MTTVLLFDRSVTDLRPGRWNRGDEMHGTGHPGVLARRREQVRVSWH